MERLGDASTARRKGRSQIADRCVGDKVLLQQRLWRHQMKRSGWPALCGWAGTMHQQMRIKGCDEELRGNI